MERKQPRIFKHLTWTDRLRIEKALGAGLRPREIASRLRVHPSTIYRELRRGQYARLDGRTYATATAYSPDIAQERYQRHLRAKGPQLKIGRDHALAQYIETAIVERGCSPAAALGYACLEGRRFKTSLSPATLYRYIKMGVFLRLTQADLPRRGRVKQRYQRIRRTAARVAAGDSIEQRPEAVRDRSEFGHWEMDTVYSRKNAGAAALLVLTERKTRREIIIAIPDRRAPTVVRALDALERRTGAARFRRVFRSITVDNGPEFSDPAAMERSAVNKTIPRTKVYYCHPYASWERGSCENANGMIRRRHPKGTDFSTLSPGEIIETERWINGYPRKIFGYQSSEAAFRACLAEIGILA